MALLRGKLFAGALFAGSLLAGALPGGQEVATYVGTDYSKYSYYSKLHAPKKLGNRVEVNDQEHLAMLRAEDELILQLIMNAVTRELL